MSALAPYAVRLHPPGTYLPADSSADTVSYDATYPVPLIDGSVLELPLRPLPGGRQAIALLMSNQTPFDVEAALAKMLTGLAEKHRPDVVVAVPTMGLDYARLVAKSLGHTEYVALGLSRKFWYDEALSERMSSSTSPDQKKSLYLDPALLSRVEGKRVLLIDDVINTGESAAAAIRLLQRAGANVESLLVTLTEGHAWRDVLATIDPAWPTHVQAAGHIPLFDATTDSRWKPNAATV